MREIKFRAWDKNKKLMVYDQDQSTGETYRLLPGDRIDVLVFKLGKAYGTLMQFTGFVDKHNKSIYEGDILDLGNDYRVKVIFEDAAFFIKDEESGDDTVLCDINCSECQIIGNIYENEELLK